MQSTLTSLKNPRWANADQTIIDCEITTSQFGDEVLPFTASQEDVEAHGRAIFADIVAGAYGDIAQYLPPPAPTPEELAAQATAKRNQLLAESDWTQLPDARAAMGAEKAAEWDAYRQALRDITDQPGYPAEIEWPVKPQ